MGWKRTPLERDLGDSCSKLNGREKKLIQFPGQAPFDTCNIDGVCYFHLALVTKREEQVGMLDSMTGHGQHGTRESEMNSISYW